MIKKYINEKSYFHHGRIDFFDSVILVLLTFMALTIITPFINVLAISFATQKEYLTTPVLLVPKDFTLFNYKFLFIDGRIWVGYRTTLYILALGLPTNMILTTSIAYGTSRPNIPFRKTLVYFIVITMLFNGGIIPMYLLMRDLGLTNNIWSVILASGINSFYVILMRNYFQSLPEDLFESAKIDGAGEWKTLYKIVIPISKPIIATIVLFFAVNRWNEWWHPMIFLRSNNMVALQLVLRHIVLESQINIADASIPAQMRFTDGIKMCAVIVTTVPIMCFYPFLQKHFIKGIMIGAIKG